MMKTEAEKIKCGKKKLKKDRNNDKKKTTIYILKWKRDSWL